LVIRPFTLLLVLVVLVAASAPMGARQDDPLRHPGVQEVRLMMNGGVSYDVMIERIRRMEDVPALDAKALQALRGQGVPERVLVELVHRKETLEPCSIRARKSAGQDVFGDPAIREVLRRSDGGTTTNDLVQYVGELHFVPVLDARALDKLTAKGISDRVLVELVRKQPIPQGCDLARVEPPGGASSAPVAASQSNKVSKKAASHEADPAQTTHKKKTKPGGGDRSAQTDGSAAPQEAPAVPAAMPTNEVHEDLAAVVGDVPPAVDSTAAPAPPGTGRVRVIVRSSLPVTFLEVQFDGKSVVRKGEIPQAETKPGWMLPPIPIVNIKKGETVLDTEVPAGSHEVEVAFGLSRIVQTQWDDVVEAYGQRYDTARVGPLDIKGAHPVCDLADGKTCVVLAQLEKRGKVYAVEYETRVHKSK
jgi:hypothetical protein